MLSLLRKKDDPVPAVDPFDMQPYIDEFNEMYDGIFGGRPLAKWTPMPEANFHILKLQMHFLKLNEKQHESSKSEQNS